MPPSPRCISSGRFLAQSGNTFSVSFDPDERIRLFVGLRLPDDVVKAVIPWQHEIFSNRAVHAVPPENLHITLAFLHSRPARDVEKIVECLREATSNQREPLELTVWRYRETSRVGMVEFHDKDGRASTIENTLTNLLWERGLYEPERRKWRAHLTVTRFRDPPKLQPPLPDLGTVSPSEAAVYHSLLRRGGAQYEALETVRLGGG